MPSSTFLCLEKEISKIMLVWTIQPKIVYDSIKKDGYFISNPLFSEYNYMYYDKHDNSFRRSYDFLISEMNKRVPKPKGYKNIKIPIWSYYKLNGDNKRPDLRVYGRFIQRKPYVLLELDIPSNELILIDGNEWCYVLNNTPSYFCHSNYEYDCIDKYYESLREEDKELFKVNSWRKNLFDLNTYDDEVFEEGWEIKHNFIEAVFWMIKKEYINRVWRYNDKL